jgi:hypothetical protein
MWGIQSTARGRGIGFRGLLAGLDTRDEVLLGEIGWKKTHGEVRRGRGMEGWSCTGFDGGNLAWVMVIDSVSFS